MGPALKLSCLSKVFAKASNVKRVALKLGLAYCGIYTFTSQVHLPNDIWLLYNHKSPAFLVLGGSDFPDLWAFHGANSI